MDMAGSPSCKLKRGRTAQTPTQPRCELLDRYLVPAYLVDRLEQRVPIDTITRLEKVVHVFGGMNPL